MEGTALPEQYRGKLFAGMLLLLSVDMTLEFFGASSFLSLPQSLSPTSKTSTDFFFFFSAQGFKRDIVSSWEFNCF